MICEEKKSKKIYRKKKVLANKSRKPSKTCITSAKPIRKFSLLSVNEPENVSAETLLQQLGRKDSVEERNFEDFFKRLTGMQEWFGEEEIATANKYSDLKELLLKNLKDIKVFKIGKIEVDIYIVGLDAENILNGVWTKAVET